MAFRMVPLSMLVLVWMNCQLIASFQIKVIVIDSEVLREGYFKSKELAAERDVRRANVGKTLDDMIADFNSKVRAYKIRESKVLKSLGPMESLDHRKDKELLALWKQINPLQDRIEKIQKDYEVKEEKRLEADQKLISRGLRRFLESINRENKGHYVFDLSLDRELGAYEVIYAATAIEFTDLALNSLNSNTSLNLENYGKVNLEEVVLVDLDVLYRGYFKTKQFEAEMEARSAETENEYQRMTKEGEEAVELYKELVAISKDSSLSKDVRDQAKEEAEGQLDLIQEKIHATKGFKENAETQNINIEVKLRELIQSEIKETIKIVAEKKGVRLVIDIDTFVEMDLGILEMVRLKMDMTDEILAYLNESDAGNAEGS